MNKAQLIDALNNTNGAINAAVASMQAIVATNTNLINKANADDNADDNAVPEEPAAA